MQLLNLFMALAPNKIEIRRIYPLLRLLVIHFHVEKDPSYYFKTDRISMEPT